VEERQRLSLSVAGRGQLEGAAVAHEQGPTPLTVHCRALPASITLDANRSGEPVGMLLRSQKWWHIDESRGFAPTRAAPKRPQLSGKVVSKALVGAVRAQASVCAGLGMSLRSVASRTARQSPGYPLALYFPD
jgi:hypothetical protein